jgi:SAM-dependent methyltransferase
MSKSMTSYVGPSRAARSAFLYAAGIGFLTLAKAKNWLQGYISPKTFDMSEVQKCVDYDIKVVDEWLTYLKSYTGDDAVQNKNVLELGPGSDLGVGLYLLAKGAATYCACDVNDLTRHAPAAFYQALFERIGAKYPGTDTQALESQLRGARDGTASRLRLAVRDDFDLTAAFAPNSIDLVFSQAAFEHFDDVSATIAQLSVVCKRGAIIVAEIDLKTHSRWIRDKDPNNIYRYSNGFYRSFWFRGLPNRMRPYQYKELLERHGWTDVSVTPIEQVADRDFDPTTLDVQFRDQRNAMGYLSVVIRARRP